MRLSKLKLVFIITPNKSKGTASGDICLYADDLRKKCGTCELIIEKDRVYIASLEINENHRRKGYGKFIIEAIKTYANLVKLPITVYAAAREISQKELRRFYKKCGMIAYTNCKDQRVKFAVTLSTLTRDDFFWIPPSLNYRKRIKLAF